jgi:hypothetical protein
VPKVASFVDLSKETKLLLCNTHQPLRINLVDFPTNHAHDNSNIKRECNHVFSPIIEFTNINNKFSCGCNG